MEFSKQIKSNHSNLLLWEEGEGGADSLDNLHCR